MPLEKQFWQISPGRKERGLWPEFSENNIIAIGWDDLGDLRNYSSIDELEKEIRRRWNEGLTSARSCWYFSRGIKKNDIVVAKHGASKEIYGIGKVTEEYNFNNEREIFKHVIGVHWYVKFDDAVKVDTSKNFVQWTAHSLKPTRFDEIKKSMLRKYPELSEKFNLLMESRARVEEGKAQVWVEITYFDGRGAEQNSLFGFSNSLWSPLTSIDGRDYYSNMKAVKAGDLVIHLAKQKPGSPKPHMLRGVSVVAKEAEIFDMPPNTRWGDKWRQRNLDPKGRIAQLRGYEELEEHLGIGEFLKNPKYSDKLMEILNQRQTCFIACTGALCDSTRVSIYPRLLWS